MGIDGCGITCGSGNAAFSKRDTARASSSTFSPSSVMVVPERVSVIRIPNWHRSGLLWSRWIDEVVGIRRSTMSSAHVSPSVKPRLTVLIGAGGSFDLGVPLTDRLTAIIRAQFAIPAPEFKNYFPSANDAERRTRLLVAAERHFGAKMNFEHLFEFIESGLALHAGWRGRGGIAEAGWTGPRADLRDLFDDENGHADFLMHSLLMLELTVRDTILEASTAALNHLVWPTFRDFWTALRDNFELTVATLNYDTLVEHALEWDGSVQGYEPAEGSSGWLFHPRLVHQRAEHRLMHLHGSVLIKGSTYGDTVGDWNAASEQWENKWFTNAEHASFASGGHLGRTACGRELHGGSIVTGLHKTEKVAAEPFMTYFEATSNELRASPRLLVIEYGFNDPHINRLIRRMTRDHGESRRVACVDYVRLPDEIHSDERSGFLGAMRLWSERGLPWNDGPSADWQALNGLWNAPSGRTQLHFHGFLTAMKRADEIVSFLGT